MNNLLTYHWMIAHELLDNKTTEEAVLIKAAEIKQQRPAKQKLIKRKAKKRGKNVANVRN